MCLRDCTPLHVWQSKVRPPTEQVAKLDMLLQEAALDTTRPQCGAQRLCGAGGGSSCDRSLAAEGNLAMCN